MPEHEKVDPREEVVVDAGCKIGDRLHEWCQSQDSVSSLLATDPSLTPADGWQKLFHRGYLDRLDQEGANQGARTAPVSGEELRRARMCGKWGPREPSDLFMRLYHDALCTLDDHPDFGVVSPCLMGSSGTVPMTIISVLPDIARHMSNLIVRAQKEVFLATNFWQNSVASHYITDAIRELSQRAQVRGARVVVKVLYDRGDPKQIFDPHHIVSESEYTGNALDLPPANDIPYVDLEVINYHQPLLGTFHAKYMVVDRMIGIVQSNNIQDNDNLEMMVQVEGPIVDSLYDMAMISWYKKLTPSLPCLQPHSAGALETTGFGASHTNMFSPTGSIKGHSAIVDSAKMPPREPYGSEATVFNDMSADTIDQDSSIKTSEKAPTNSRCLRNDPRTPEQSGKDVLTSTRRFATIDDVSSGAQKPNSPPSVRSQLYAGKTWPEHTTDDPHYDNDLASEVSRVQAAVSAKPDETAMQAVTRHLNHSLNVGYPGDAPDCDPADEMTPYVPHPAHEPFPIALVNRAPYGRLNHKSTTNPQNAAWLSALRNAQRNVFIQTPTLNAQPLIPAIVAACERGVDVYCYVCLGYNDAGEMLPMQGGHNDKIAHQLYTTLSPARRQHLHWYWYVAKDQTRPIPAVQKKRSCHIKLMIVDERVGIAGSGNQDTQSWFHSQEVNLMLDSPEICRAWIDALRRNQNTGIYGAVDREDGIWRDEQGKGVEGATGTDAGRFSWFNGFVGAIKRFQGTGGF
ncbi:putative iq calmodulin-binding motif protein [Rosellinia necatrix]|uniref:Putative iq calmodulin-binding motif protein n=1 Tax=Rosellinia necatrix TaxID=77044 RepID=A0A1W2TW10_ROSNE|nr:putative iq calmodulin-binding motif protein [Rosellinia necatrix]